VENVARRIFPIEKKTRQKLPDGENFAGLSGQLLPLFIKRAAAKWRNRAKKISAGATQKQSPIGVKSFSNSSRISKEKRGDACASPLYFGPKPQII
jgi:hypothetical protein